MSAVRSRQHPPDLGISGAVVQLVRIPACHAGGRGFESRPLRQLFCPLQSDARERAPKTAHNENEKGRIMMAAFFYCVPVGCCARWLLCPLVAVPVGHRAGEWDSLHAPF